MKPSRHYDHVTDAWKLFMGDNLHFGYFENPDDDLAAATCRLIDRMLEYCSITKKSRILDVGCGIGGPAFYIHEKFKCHVTGISTSQRGVDLANISSREKGHDVSVNFILADGQRNGFPDKSFDIVWAMESSHLMNKKELFSESFRVLKDGGTLVLCDIVLLKIMPLLQQVFYYVKNVSSLVNAKKTWGFLTINSPGVYCNALLEAGFNEISAIDVSHKTVPTMRHWVENAIARGNKGIDNSFFSTQDCKRFIEACRSVERFFNEGYLGYSIIKADKPAIE